MIELLLVMQIMSPITFEWGTLSIDEPFPLACYQGMKENEILAGCVKYNYYDFHIFLDSRYLHTVDPFGYTALWHEMKHVICRCNWHDNLV